MVSQGIASPNYGIMLWRKIIYPAIEIKGYLYTEVLDYLEILSIDPIGNEEINVGFRNSNQ